MDRIVSLALAATLLVAPFASAQSRDADQQAIQELLESSYVKGVFVDRDESLVRAGFHAEFVMPIILDGQLIVAPLDMWLEHLQLDGQPGPDSIRPVFERIDVTGRTATVKMQIWTNDELTYTDYFSLYKLDGEWKIVTKVFSSHG